MYKVYQVHASAVMRGELQTFDPLTNNHGFECYEAVQMPTYELETAAPACNARPFGPALENKIAPPKFELVFSDDQTITMRIGPDALHAFTASLQVQNMHEAEQVAQESIAVMGKVHHMLERCSEDELRKVDMSSDLNRLSFVVAAEGLRSPEDTFADDVMSKTAASLGENVSAYTVQNLYTSYMQPYYDALQQGEGTPVEKVSRALQIAGANLAESGIAAQDRYTISQFLQNASNMVEGMWQARNENLWQQWQATDIAVEVPAKFSAMFKTSFIEEMNMDLGMENWNGYIPAIYEAASNAASKAMAQARQQGDFDTANMYLHVRQLCDDALENELTGGNKDDAAHHEHDRGYQTYDQAEAAGEVAEDWEEEEHTGPGGI